MAAEPICTSIEPVTKTIQCQRTALHCGMHWATGLDAEGGTWVAEWHDLEEIKSFFSTTPKRGNP